MLRAGQEEQIKYFYLDRKLGSGNVGEVGEALDQIDLCLPRLRKLDLVNSLVLRLLDLLHSARAFHLKHRVARLFANHAALLLTIHSRDEIAAVLARCLKGSDQFTRMLAIQIITALPALFLKDVAVYHTLLAKLSPVGTLSREQKKEAVTCLGRLLPASAQLSRLFSKNISEIQQQYQIPLHILIYLLTFVTIDSHLQRHILQSVLALINAPTKRGTRREIYYFQKLVVNYAAANYRIVEFYAATLKQTLPNIHSIINKIKSKKYPFMKDAHPPQNNISIEELLDELYERKKEGEKLQEYQSIITPLLAECIRQPKHLPTKILLAYFLEDDASTFDKEVAVVLQGSHQLWSKRLLKQTLAVGLYESSRFLLQKFELYQSNYILLKLYLEFKIADSSQALLQLLEVISTLDQTFSSLLQCWSIMGQILQAKVCNGISEHTISPLYESLVECFHSMKAHASFPLKQQLEIVSIFLHGRESSVGELKIKSYYIIPSCLLDSRRFWFAYLGKRTLVSLFSTLL